MPRPARYADAFAVTRAATRAAAERAGIAPGAGCGLGAVHAALSSAPGGDDMAPIDALGTFYEYRELTPIGRRGDEMIRRLADRLVGVDLLDQAADLLQYQVDKRLEGAARAQVAARLAMVYLMNRKPERAIAALRSSRIADLSANCASSGCCWRRGRRAMSAGTTSRSTSSRTSADARRSGCAPTSTGRRGTGARRSEQIELYYGDRWRDFTPLNPSEKADIIRAVVGYALGEDAIGLSAVPREIRAADVGRRRQAGVRRGQQAGRDLERRVRPDCADGCRASTRSTASSAR